jgi:CHAT domain-containing protein
MESYEQKVLGMANSLQPAEIIDWIENRANPNKKGLSFLAFAETLLKNYNYSLALILVRCALDYFIRDKNKKGELNCYADIGIIYYRQAKFNDSIIYSKKGLEIALELKDRYAESSCYLNISIALNLMGNFDESKKYLEEAIKIKELLNDKAGIMGCYISFSTILSKKGDFRQAIEYSGRALKIALDLQDKIAASACYVNLSYDHRNIGELEKSLEYAKRALEIKQFLKDREGIAHCYINEGLVHRGLSNYRKALECQVNALDMAVDLEDKLAESACCVNISATLIIMNDLVEAKRYVERALKIKQAIQDQAGIIHCNITFSTISNELGNFHEAIEYAQTAIKLAKNIKLEEGLPYCYGALANAYFNSGNLSKTEEYTKLALKSSIESGNKEIESKCYGLMCGIQEKKNPVKIVEYAEKILNIAKEIGNLSQAQYANLILGRYYYEINDDKLAYIHLKRSIKLSEIIIGKLVEEPHKILFYEQASVAYQIMVALCLKENKIREAFEYVEGSKSRVLLELISSAPIKFTAELSKESKALLEEEANCLARLREIQIRCHKPLDISVVFGETDQIIDQLELVYNELETFDPEYVSLRRAKPMSVDQIIYSLTTLRKNAILVEYFFAETTLLIFTVSSKTNELNVTEVPLHEEELKLYFQNFEKEVVSYPEYVDLGESWLDLSNLLIGKISDLLKGHDLICFVPYGQLHRLPLHALKLDGEPLIKHYSVVYYPSASLLKFVTIRGSGKLDSCIAFGFVGDNEPSLKLIVEETANTVAKIFNGKSFTGVTATKESVFKESAIKDIIHFSCHGFFDEKTPMNSGIELYDNNVLTAKEIFGIKLDAELLTLAACETAIGQRSLGDELIGLTRSFLYAGTASVVASLWPVDPVVTKELMQRFYQNLKEGIDKSIALQKAQKEIMQKYPHTALWAPFILIGKPT